jgi:eukaryotic translation initiation factor 2C
LELCVVPEGKIMKKELFQDKTDKMVEFSRMRPSDRFGDIKRGLDVTAPLSPLVMV